MRSPLRRRLWYPALSAAHVISGLIPTPAARTFNRLTKPVLMPTLAFTTKDASTEVRVALAASTVGDTALMSGTSAGILGGIAGFGAAHLAYLRELLALGRDADRCTTLGVAAGAAGVTGAAAAILRRVLQDSGRPQLVGPVIGYAGLCAGMGAAAVRAGIALGGRRGRTLVLGGCLFVISDSLVAADLFGPDRWGRSGVLYTAVMVTYLAAQACLVSGLTPGDHADDTNGR